MQLSSVSLYDPQAAPGLHTCERGYQVGAIKDHHQPVDRAGGRHLDRTGLKVFGKYTASLFHGVYNKVCICFHMTNPSADRRSLEVITSLHLDAAALVPKREH
jgi:hypothetical protein